MNQRFFIFIIVLNLIFSCTPKKENKGEKIESTINGYKEKITRTEQFQNSIKIDTSLTKKIAFEFIKISNSKKLTVFYQYANAKKTKRITSSEYN